MQARIFISRSLNQATREANDIGLNLHCCGFRKFWQSISGNSGRCFALRAALGCRYMRPNLGDAVMRASRLARIVDALRRAPRGEFRAWALSWNCGAVQQVRGDESGALCGLLLPRRVHLSETTEAISLGERTNGRILAGLPWTSDCLKSTSESESTRARPMSATTQHLLSC